ncbi:hypothetical protein A4G26_26570 [Mycobacterium kansasii]|nr:hypothetical protein A4G26_26570 [Mycobacterium kansasii]
MLDGGAGQIGALPAGPSGWDLSAFAGSSRASALMATTTSGWKSRGPSCPGQIGQAGQAMVEEAQFTLGDGPH